MDEIRWLVGFVLVLAAAAGCIGSDDEGLDPSATNETSSYDDLSAPNADEVRATANDTRVFVFEGTTDKPGTRVAFFFGPNIRTSFLEESFEVDGSVGYAEVELDFDTSQGNLDAFLVDDEDRTQCRASNQTPPASCNAPVPSGTSTAEWTVEVRAGEFTVEPGTSFTARVELHPPSHIERGDPLEGVDRSIDFRVADTGLEPAEPTAGVLSDGTIFVVGWTDVVRSTDRGQTWENVAPPGNDQLSGDPMLHVDEYTDTVYVDHLYGACSHLSISKDAGDTWVNNPAACGLPGNDHQKLAVGPNPTPAPTNAVYYAYVSFAEGAWVSRSLDGGATWTSTLVTADAPYRSTGPIEADREGTVFVPYYLCDGGIGVGVSQDYGATFDYQRVVDEPITCQGSHATDVDPGPAVDAEGNLYVAYRTNEGVKYIASTDRGETWSEPVNVTLPEHRSFTHVDAVAGDEGRLAIAYRATPDSDAGPNSDGWAAWHMYVAFVTNATGEDPDVETGIVNDPDDPVQRGRICSDGGSCTAGSRNLYDFIDVVVGPEGRAHVAYADGCDAPCPTPADSREQLGLVGILEEGPMLFEDTAPWADGSGAASADVELPGHGDRGT